MTMAASVALKPKNEGASNKRITWTGKPAAGRKIMLTAEQQRLNDTRQEKFAWKKWGPYLSERQWGTVREDYSKDGNAWDYSGDQLSVYMKRYQAGRRCLIRTASRRE